MKVVITGGRDYDDRERLFAALDNIHAHTPITLIRNGGMTGADALSSRWAYERKVDTECVGALWGQYGGKAGPIRNTRMLGMGTDLLVAFPGGRGTANTVACASRSGIRIYEVESEGT